MKSPWHLVGPHEVAVDQLVECLQRLPVFHAGCRRREVELEWVAGHGGRLGQAARRRRKGVELADDRG